MIWTVLGALTLAVATAAAINDGLKNPPHPPLTGVALGAVAAIFFLAGMTGSAMPTLQNQLGRTIVRALLEAFLT